MAKPQGGLTKWFKEISEMVLEHEKPAPIPVPEVREYDTLEEAIAEED